MYILRGFLTGFSAYVSLVSIISRIQPSGCSFREPTSNHISLLYIQAQFTEAFKNFLALHSAYSSSIFHTYSHPSSHGEALMLQFSQCFRVAHRLAQISSQISSWYFVKCLLSHTYLVTSIYSSSNTTVTSPHPCLGQDRSPLPKCPHHYLFIPPLWHL